MKAKDRRRQTADHRPSRETVLFAVTGMSPAILTETVWALAHETPAIIPDRVVVVTTRAGRDAIRRELFTDHGSLSTGSVWDQLRAALAPIIRAHPGASMAPLRFGTTADDIRVFTTTDARGRSVELDDIRTPADNEAAADFLLDALRSFTENPDIRLIGSLAGGRKTMGALLYACLSLIGRDTDRLTHVLVNEPFDDPRLNPRFYFPTTPPTTHRLPEIRNPKSEIINSRSARIQLADVPFVPLRQLFPRELGRLPGRFTHLVQQYRKTVGQLAAPPRVELADDKPIVRVDGVPVRLPVTAYALLSFLVDRARRRAPAFLAYKDAVDPFKAFVADWARDRMDYRYDAFEKLKDVDDAMFRKLCNTLGETFRKAGLPPATAAHLRPARGHFGIRLR
jgi:CRISPR-associated protein (TIGR02584 family)